MNDPHFCKCSWVSRCGIYTHPSPDIQDKLNTLIDAMAGFDDKTGSSSLLFFRTYHALGVFTTLTQEAQDDR